jgi:hypothetical protein
LEKADGKNTRAAPWTCFFYFRRLRSFALGWFAHGVASSVVPWSFVDA